MNQCHVPPMPMAEVNPAIDEITVLSSEEVWRASICDEVCNAPPATRVVLFTAAAGFGKTVAMQQCHRRLFAAGTNAAWLALRPAHNNPVRLLTALADVAQSIRGEDLPCAGLPNALQALGSADTPFALFVDDFDNVTDPAALAILGELIDNMPVGSRVLIGSRKSVRASIPTLTQLRTRGQVLEVDTERLRFSLAETRSYFRLGEHQALSETTQLELYAKSEGWVEVLRLARLVASRGELDSALVNGLGSSQSLAAVLGEQVLALQPEPLRMFMLRTSVLRQLDTSICRALWPHGDIEWIFDQLEQSNLLAPAEGDRFAKRRYHGLLAEFLRVRLRQEHPEEYLRVHLAASSWYETNGQLVLAINHAIEGGDTIHALDLLEPNVDEFLQNGRMRLLATWFSSMPQSAIEKIPRVLAASLWATCFTQGAERAMMRLEGFTARFGDDSDFQAHANAQRPVFLQMLDRMDEACPVGMRSLEALPTASSFADSTLLNAMAFQSVLMGKPHEAHRLVDASKLVLGDSKFNRMHSESMEGLLKLEQARLREAAAHFRIALKAAPGSLYSGGIGNAWAGVLYVAALYERNELAEAQRLLRIYLPMASSAGLPDHIITGHVMQARLSFIAGDVDHAFEVLGDLESIGYERQLERISASARLERSRVLLLQGNLTAAAEEVKRGRGGGELWRRVSRQRLPAHHVEDYEIANLRVDLASGKFDQVIAKTGRSVTASKDAGRHRRVLKLKVLRSMALRGSGDLRAAGETMLDVLAAGAQEGFVRLLLDEGAGAEEVVRFCAKTLHNLDPYPSPILEDYVDKLSALLGPSTADASGGKGAEHQAAALLTQRELCILELVAQGYSNVAIGDKLFVSENTVRTHLRNINVKLDAKSRTQAIAVGRRLGILR